MRKYMLLLISVLLTFVTSVAYSALSTSLAISSEVKFRPLADIRINEIALAGASGGQLAYESEFSKNTVSTGFTLPTPGASISYRVRVDNSGDVDYSIYDILRSASDNGLNVTVSGYNVTDVIPAKSSVDLILTYTTSNPSDTVINVVDTMDFRKIYYVTYETDTNQTIPAQVKYEGENLTLTSQQPTKNGYTFSTWNTKIDGTGTNYTSGATYSLDENKILYARYTLNTYNINYVMNGGTNPNVNPTTYTIESSDITLANATKEGYEFKGWTGNGTTVATKNLVLPAGSYGDKEYTAVFRDETPPTIEVTNQDKTKNYLTSNYTLNTGWNASTVDVPVYIDAQDVGSGVDKIEYVYSNSTTVPTTGWVETTNGLLTVNKGLGSYYLHVRVTDKENNVTTVTTKKITVRYRIAYHDDYSKSASVSENQYYTGTAITTRTPPAVEGYTFDGWYSNTALTTKVVDANASYSPTTSIKLYGKWTQNYYDITYAMNNGINNENNPTRYNNTAGAITLAAPTKTLTFKGNPNATSGANAASGTVTIGTDTTKAQTFAGWTGSNGNTPQTSVTIPTGSTGDKSYTAHWTAVAGTVPTVTRTGYTCGWSTTSTGTTIEIASGGSYDTSRITEGMAATVNLYAVCNPDNYTLTINPNGGVYNNTISNSTKTMTYDSSNNNDIGVPTRNGYTFDGWYTEQNNGIQVYGTDGHNTNATGYFSAAYSTGVWKKTSAVTVYAHWTEKTYTLTINPNGGSFESGTSSVVRNLKYSDVSDITAPTKTGYTFTGWSELESTRTQENSAAPRAYTNSGTGSITVVSQSKSVDNPLSLVSNEYKVENDGLAQTNPALGGFAKTAYASETSNYVHVFVAKLPVGYYFHNANNPLGTGATTKWLTSNEGTGSWQTYAYQVNTGTGTIRDFGHVYVADDPTKVWGRNGADTGTYTAYLAFSNIYNITTNSAAIGQYDGTATLTASWTPNTYSVTLDNQSAATAGTTKVYYKYNTHDGNCYYYTDSSLQTCLTNSKITNPTKNGYTFGGYYTATNGSGTQYVNASGTFINNIYTKVPSEINNTYTTDITLYAKWTRNTYTVTYNTTENGGTGTIANANVAFGDPIALPTTGASKSGWTFVGWNTDKNATTALSSLTMGTDNVVLYAIYRKEAVTLTANWDANGATLSSTTQSTCTLAAVYNNETQATSCTVTAPTITRENYEVVGFNQSSSATTNDSNYNVSTGKLTLTSSNTNKIWYAITKAGAPLTVTFANNNGATVASATASCYLYGSNTSCQVDTPTVTPQSGFTHIGFNTSASSTSNNSNYNTSTKKLTVTNSGTWYPITKSSSQYTATFTILDSNAATQSGGTLSCYRYNGGTDCSIKAPTLTAKSGYVVLGWSAINNSQTAEYASAANITINSNKTFYSVTYYNTVVTITFNRNVTNSKAISLTPKGGTASTEAAVTVTCNKMNGSTTCDITSPTMEVLTGYHEVGFATSTSATTSSWNTNVEKEVSTDATYYAITAGNSYSIRFNANCPSGITPTGTMSNLSMIYGTAKNLTANAFGCAGRVFSGWALNAQGTGTSYEDEESVSNLTTTNGETVDLYAKWRYTPPSPTISGGTSKIYGASATTLTCTENTSYPSGISKYYSFGYATSSTGTPGNWTDASTTNTLSVASTAYVGERYYSCRVYASDGTEVSDTEVSSNKTTMTLKNAKITYNPGNCETITGTSPAYVNKSMTGVYTGATNTTAGTMATASKSGYTFQGWYAPTTATGLPSSYTRVDYIESNGTQYIDTGYKATASTGVQIDYQFTDINPTQQRLFGADSSSDSYLNYHMYINGASNWAYAFKDGAGNWINTGIAANTSRHTIKFNMTSGQYSIDSTNGTISSSTRTKTAQTNMYIMWYSSSDTGGLKAKMKLYSFKIYSNNNTGLVRDFVPAINNSTGKAGLYDLVTDTFYGNAGTGDFIIGNNTKVISADGTIQSSVANWTDANSKWLLTTNKELVAKCTPNYTVTFNYQNNVYNQDVNTWTMHGSTNVDRAYQYNNTISAAVYSNSSLYTGLVIPLNSDVKPNTNYRISVTAKRTGSITGNLRMYVGTRNSSNTVISYNHYINVNNSTTEVNTWKELSATFNSGSYSTIDPIRLDYDTANQGPVYVSNIRLDEYTTQSKAYEGTYGSMPTPTRTGYTFAGWYTSPSGGTQVTSSTPVTAVGNHTLYAHWTANNYTLTVNPSSGSFNGSTSNTTYSQAFDRQKVLPLPTRAGYTFTGWSKNGAGTITKLGTPKYAEPYGSAAVYNNAGGGTVTHTSVARSSDSPILTSANMLQIKTAGTASPGLGGFYQNTQSRANARFYHVIVAKIPVGYTIEHAQNPTGDGRVITWLTPQQGTGNFETYIYEHICGSTGTFSTFGHVYLNGAAATSSNPVTWYVAYAQVFDFTAGVPESASQIFRYGAGNTTLTANWTYAKYAVAFNANGGSGGQSASVTATYNTAMPAISTTAPTRNGYTFGGWYDTSAASGGTQYYTAAGASARSYNKTSGTTLYARWTPVNYSISYNLNGGSVTGNPTSYNITTAAFTLKNPSRPGYTFTGWSGTGLSGSANKTVTIAQGSTGNRSYTANWSANSYYLDVNGLINGKTKGSTAYCGTFDVYTGGTLRANDVTDYYNSWVTGTSYSISDIKAISGSGCTYNGVSSGSATGTITSSNVAVQLKFTFSSKSFGYTGGVQSFVAPIEGTYQLKVWGAQGGNLSGSLTGGLGGYAVGNKALTVHQTIYIIVGQQPTTPYGGYNGGGDGNGVAGDWENNAYARGGGGCTHIGTINAQLKDYGTSYRNGSSIFVVAGGGGGASEKNNGGAGGGASGSAGGSGYGYGGGGGTQSGGGAGGNDGSGYAGGFGYGGRAEPLSGAEPYCGWSNGSIYYAGGGGSGWYGGGGGGWTSDCWSGGSTAVGAGGGGSGYTGGVTSGSMSNGQRSGSGYATISWVS